MRSTDKIFISLMSMAMVLVGSGVSPAKEGAGQKPPPDGKPTKTLLENSTLKNGGAFSVVRSGQPAAEIVIAKDAPAGMQNAARDLQGFIEKMSGAKLPIVNAPSRGALQPIFVGENEFTAQLGYQLPKFDSSGYDILVTGNYTILAGPNTIFPKSKFQNLEEFQKFVGDKYLPEHFQSGGGAFNKPLDMFLNDDVGAWYAVSALLERLGVRFYAPYEEGTIVPVAKDISLQPGRETRQAAFERREWHHAGRENEKDAALWFKRMKTGSRVGVVSNHTTRTLIGDPEMRTRHPSWFAEESPGKLFPGFANQGGVPRYTDPDFLRACVDWARKLLDTYPTLSQVTVGAPEDSGDPEHGDPYDWRDKKIYQKPGMSHKQAYANMMWDFHTAIARELKKTHPDKGLIWWCLYNNSVPTNIDPENHPDNILCRVEAVPPSYYLLKDEKERYFREIEAQWAAFQPRDKSQQWEWWLDYWFPTSPRYPEFFTHSLQETRQKQRKYFDGFFMETPAQSVNGTIRLTEVPISHLMIYVNNKLLWDPDLDVDALLNEYYRLWFGPAEKEMKAFHEYAEKVWLRPGSRSVSGVTGFLKKEDVDEYFRLLETAREKTAPGTVYRRRIEAMEDSYAGLKTLFKDREPQGPKIHLTTLPDDAAVDGDLSKYQGAWVTLPGSQETSGASQNKTEFSVALTRDKKRLFVAVRSFEEKMEQLVAQTKDFDKADIFQDDHVRIDVNTPEKNWFTVAINPAGALFDESRDLELINRYALPVLWTPGTQSHVNKRGDRWEVEVSIPTRDFGTHGPTAEYPWGLNVERVRRAGGSRESQSLATEKPSSWARLARDATPTPESDTPPSPKKPSQKNE